jgi:hypothetical protein
VIDNNDRRGNERVWVSVADTIGATSVRKWGAHNGWHAVGNGNMNNPADNRTGASGGVTADFTREHGGSPGTTWDMYQVKASESLTTSAGSLGSRLAFSTATLAGSKKARTGPTQDMLAAYYSLMLFLSGDLNSGVMGPFSNRSQNDAGLIMAWLAQGNAVVQNRGFWAIGDGFVESNRASAAGTNQRILLDNFLGVDLDTPAGLGDVTTDEVVDLVLQPTWQGKKSTAFHFFGVRSICTFTNDLLKRGAIGADVLDASKYQRKSTGPLVPERLASLFKDYAPLVNRPWKTLVDGWDIEHLTNRNDVNTLARSIYMNRIFTTAWAKIWTVTGSPIVPLDVPSFEDGGLVDFVGKWANNPMASGTASIQLGLAKPQRVQVKIFDVSGRLVRTLADRSFEAGNHTLVWDGSDNGGHQVPRGVYFSQVIGPMSAARKITVLH